MRRHPLIFFITILLMVPSYTSWAQGCSDAGICSMGNHPASSADSSSALASTSEFKLALSSASGEQGVFIFQLIPELNVKLNPSLTWQVKSPLMLITGNLANNSGIGDITTGFNYRLKPIKKHNINLSIGGKMPVNKADHSVTGKSLPMPYQTSLGTYDLVLGVSVSGKRWTVATGYQHVLKHNNQNAFNHLSWKGNTDAQKYFESNQLRRGNDVSLRIERYFQTRKLKGSAGILAIYRLSEDGITTLPAGIEKSLANSAGATVNITGTAIYALPRQTSISIQIGVPTIVRSVRADGLTRSAIINITYIYPLKHKSPTS